MRSAILITLLVAGGAASAARFDFMNLLVGADPRVRPGADTWVGPYIDGFVRVGADFVLRNRRGLKDLQRDRVECETF